MVRIRFPPAVSRQTIGSSAAEPHLPCPVREEIYRVAARLQLNVFVVFNGSRPIGPPGSSNVHMVLVGDTADAADDWIAEHISAAEVRHLRYPVGITLSKAGSAGRVLYQQSVDTGEYR
jgi:hypothetical protein